MRATLNSLMTRRPLSYRNQKSMDWFLYDNGLRHERVKWTMKNEWTNCTKNEHIVIVLKSVLDVTEPFWRDNSESRVNHKTENNCYHIIQVNRQKRNVKFHNNFSRVFLNLSSPIYSLIVNLKYWKIWHDE